MRDMCSVVNSSSLTTFSKDGRKISIGDCALFKPHQDSPPFIGIIRRLISREEETLKLSVNWLYRSADVKLGKGGSIEAAPNEVFYSFHKDEIPAASLLHPCKVAFLCKGVELPSGISSFVSRRVYDVENKCLWWLTDQDYINERQLEVDLLLQKTQLDMHGAVQSGGRSPKVLNGIAASQHIKPGSESVQNISSHSQSQIKSKKRDRADQCSDQVKKERLSRADDTDIGNFRADHTRLEIAKITDSGGLVDYEGVEKLVKLMQPGSSEKKIDLACRMMLVDVIAVTEKFDCLGQFIKLRGLLVLDEWLQEVHKGKISDLSSPKESDKSVDEFLLILLRALDRLPVNLHGLQTSNVGKSVNHLRTHKNIEIQKKARSLVDTWKKRVEAEMNVVDSKFGETKSILPDVSPRANRHTRGLSEVIGKSPGAQSSGKMPFTKFGPSEPVAKIVVPSPNSIKTVESNTNVPLSVNVPGSDLLSTIKEEKSSCFSHSQNNSQHSPIDNTRALELRKKYRNLVDTCEKRCGPRTNVLDSKSGSSHGSTWATKSTLPDVSPRANRHTGAIFEGSGKSPSPQSSGKMPFNKFGSNETVANIMAPSSTIVPVSVNVPGSVLLSTIKEEKSSSSSHCQNNIQPCSIDNTKTIGTSCREDIQNSSSASISSTRLSLSSPHQQKSSYSFQGSDLLGVHKETSSLQLSLNKSVGSEKLSLPGGTHEKVSEMAALDHGNSQRLIVGLPNAGRSPALSSDGDPYEDRTALIKTSPSARSVKIDILDRKVKGKDVEDKCVLVKSEEGSLSPLLAYCCDKKQSTDHCEMVMGSLAGTGLSSGYNPREGNLYDASFKSMNALVESCAKFSEASTSASGGDCMGMNLLASVAVGEMSRSDGSASVSRGKNLPVPEESFSVNDVNSIHVDDDTARSEDPASNEGSMLVQDNLIEPRVKYESAADPICILATLSVANKASPNAVISENAIAKEIVNIEIAGNFHGQRMSCTVSSVVDKDMNASHPNEMNMEDYLLKPPKAVGNTKPVKKEDKGALQSISSIEMCGEENKEVPRSASCHQMLNEQKLRAMANANQESLVGQCEVSALPSNSVNAKSLEVGPDADTNATTQIEQSGNQNDNFASTVSDQAKNPVEKSNNKFIGHYPREFLSKEPTKVLVQQTSYLAKINEDEAGESEVVVKLDFDLNEGFDVDDGIEEEAVKSPLHENPSSVKLPCPLQLPLSSLSSSFPVPVTVASAAKGPFYPPENSFRGNRKSGWKGPADASAFRPAEPKKLLSRTTDPPPVDKLVSKKQRPHLDFDLNVADEKDLEMESHGGGLDFDLNRLDVNNSCNIASSQIFYRPSLSEGFRNAELHTLRDFDLNNGPGPDDAASETATQANTNVPFLSPLPGVQISGSDQQRFSSWFPQGSSYPPISITPVLPNRGEQGYPIASGPQRIMAYPATISPFAPEYRGQVFSSSPALPFPTNVPFQYPFPFEINFPMTSHSYPNTSTSHPSVCPQLVAPSGVVSSYPRGYMMNIPGGAANSGLDSRRWVGQALDLNSDPGSAEVERREEMLPSALQQNFSPGSQPFSANKQLRMYQMAGGSLKRKDPDGGWDGERTSYKQPPPWQ